MKRKLLAAAAFAAATLSPAAFATGADDTWTDYRKANNLSLYPPASNPAVSSDWIMMEMSLGEGNADRLQKVNAIQTRYGGNGSAKGDGDTKEAKDGVDKAQEVRKEASR
jgi:hypothetical protein